MLTNPCKHHDPPTVIHEGIAKLRHLHVLQSGPLFGSERAQVVDHIDELLSELGRDSPKSTAPAIIARAVRTPPRTIATSKPRAIRRGLILLIGISSSVAASSILASPVLSIPILASPILVPPGLPAADGLILLRLLSQR